MTRGWALCAVLCGAFLGVSPAQGNAATVNVSPDGTVRYDAARGERNRVAVWDSQNGEVGFFEPGIVAGAGCRGAYLNEAYCAAPSGARLRVEARTGDLHDELSLTFPLSFSVMISGGPGDDKLTAPGGDVAIERPVWLDEFELAGTALQAGVRQPRPATSLTLLGGPGNDILLAGRGADRFVPGPDLDYVWSGPGADRINARDGSTDHIDCQHSADRLVLDRHDFPYGSCGPTQRRGAAFVLPLYVSWNDDYDSGDTEVMLGCPADSPSPCRGEVKVRIRGGRTVLSKHFRVAPGAIGGASASLNNATNLRLVRRGPVVTVRGRDSKERLRSLTRRLEAVHSSPGDPA